MSAHSLQRAQPEQCGRMSRANFQGLGVRVMGRFHIPGTLQACAKIEKRGRSFGMCLNKDLPEGYRLFGVPALYEQVIQ